MSAPARGLDWFGVAAWAGWLAWAALCAMATRFAIIAVAAWTMPRLSQRDKVVLTYPVMVVILIVSLTLHLAILGEPRIYGADAWDVFNLGGLLFAPFGLPLAFGLVLLVLFDVLRSLLSTISRRLSP